MVRTLPFHGQGRGFDPWSGELRSRKPLGHGKKIKKEKKEKRVPVDKRLQEDEWASAKGGREGEPDVREEGGRRCRNRGVGGGGKA